MCMHRCVHIYFVLVQRSEGNWQKLLLFFRHEAGNQTPITKLRGKQLFLPIKFYLATVSNTLKRRILSTKEAV